MKKNVNKCSYCNREFKQKEHLDYHIKSQHTNEKNFKCTHEGCNAAFVRLRDLTIHERIHTDTRPHKCPYENCDKAFKQLAHLNDHICLHTGNYKYKCEECDKKFIQKGQLKRHMRVHTKEKPYECEVCGKKFAHSSSFVCHKRTHTDELPYKCDICGKSFKQSGSLQNHIRTHTDERPYVCQFPGCNKKFKQSGTLKDHMTTHYEERPFKCDYEGCDWCFKVKSTLKKHFKHIHSSEGIVKQKRQENMVSNLLKKNNIDFKREHTINFDCFYKDSKKKFARIDFVIQKKSGIIFLEVDENQHSYGYEPSCDMKRMSHVISALSLEGNTLPITFVRFNPNHFKINGKATKLKQTDKRERLLKWIQDYSPDTNKPLQIVYMFYDTIDTNNELFVEVSLHPDYHEHIRDCIQEIIVDV